MIVETFYRCEICHQRYDTEAMAHECEQRGYASEYPIGMIYGNHVEEAFYSNITFSVAKNLLDNHFNLISSWACRDNGYGDSLDGETCGSANIRNLGKYDGKCDPKHPSFLRMVSYLTRKFPTKPVLVWDGEKPITLKEYKRKFQNENRTAQGSN